MGRAERRLAEKLRNRENRRDNVTLSRSDISEMKEKISAEAAKYDTEFLMTCFALAEHRLYGFGQKRILKSLKYIDELMGDILNNKATIEEYKDLLEKEAGVAIKF